MEEIIRNCLFCFVFCQKLPAPDTYVFVCDEQRIQTACRLEGRYSHLSTILNLESVKKKLETDTRL